MKIPGLPDILISRAKLEAQCERYGHDWLNQVGFGVFCRRCGAAPSNQEIKLTRGGSRDDLETSRTEPEGSGSLFPDR